MKARPLAVVTGGCRRLGATISAHLAAAGWDLALHGHRDAEPAPHLASAIRDAGVHSSVTVADFTDLAAVETLLPSIAAEWGRPPDLLVNNASLFGQDRLTDTTAIALVDHYAVNCAAPALLTRQFANFTSSGAPDGERCVVNILDQRIVQPHADQFAYTLSKMALAGLTEIAARALAPSVRVNAVAPGLTLPTSEYSPDLIDDLRAMMPLARLPAPEDVASAVLYLAKARAITGQTMFVDAGARFRPWARDFHHIRA